MSLLRTTTLRTSSVLLRAPAVASMTVRGYAAGPGGSDSGATASSTGFKQREQVSLHPFWL